MKIGKFLLVFAMAVTAAGEDVERPATVKVAAVQCSSDLGAVEANLAKLAFLIEEAARNGAKIIVLPGRRSLDISRRIPS